MRVFVPWKYICVTIVQMKCTHAKFGNTELRSRHNKALSVVHTHMVHRYLTVRLSQLNVTVHITYVYYAIPWSVQAALVIGAGCMSSIRCNLEAFLFNAYQRHCHFASHTMLTNDCSLLLPHFSYVLYTVSLEIQT